MVRCAHTAQCIQFNYTTSIRDHYMTLFTDLHNLVLSGYLCVCHVLVRDIIDDAHIKLKCASKQGNKR